MSEEVKRFEICEGSLFSRVHGGPENIDEALFNIKYGYDTLSCIQSGDHTLSGELLEKVKDLAHHLIHRSNVEMRAGLPTKEQYEEDVREQEKFAYSPAGQEESPISAGLPIPSIEKNRDPTVGFEKEREDGKE